jgi:CO/xanthine dehydrogenase Mo-binding subunit
LRGEQANAVDVELQDRSGLLRGQHLYCPKSNSRETREQWLSQMALALHGQSARFQVKALQVQAGQLTPAQAQVEGQAQKSPPALSSSRSSRARSSRRMPPAGASVVAVALQLLTGQLRVSQGLTTIY